MRYSRARIASPGQGDEEKKRGLPVAPFMDRELTNVFKMTYSFIDYAARPLFTALMGLFPPVQEWLHQMELNYTRLKAMEQGKEPVPKLEELPDDFDDDDDEQLDDSLGRSTGASPAASPLVIDGNPPFVSVHAAAAAAAGGSLSSPSAPMSIPVNPAMHRVRSGSFSASGEIVVYSPASTSPPSLASTLTANAASVATTPLTSLSAASRGPQTPGSPPIIMIEETTL